MSRDVSGDIDLIEEKELIAEEALMSFKVEKDKEGRFCVSFKVHGEGCTTNEFIFGTDEDEAKSKTAHLVSNLLQGLEYVQDQVREVYGQAEDSAEDAITVGE